MENNNNAVIVGQIVSDITYNNEVCGKKIYKAYISSRRVSGIEDVIPVLIPDTAMQAQAEFKKGDRVHVLGQYRSYVMLKKDDKKRYKRFLFVLDIWHTEESDLNEISAHGYLIDKPNIRKTFRGRDIADFELIVNGLYGHTNRILCICWGTFARCAALWEAGMELTIHGRIQSREYHKTLSNGDIVTGVTYEVSVDKMEVIQDEQD